MTGALEACYTVALLVAVWATGLHVGMEHGFRRVAESLRRTGLLARALAVNVLVVPLIVWALVGLADLPRGFRIGLLLVGIASAGPLGIKAAAVGRGAVAYAASLVVILELANLAAIPIWSAVTMPAGTAVPFAEIVEVLALVVVLPLATGMSIRAKRPALAARWAAPAGTVSTIALATLVTVALILDSSSVRAGFSSGVPAVALVTVAAALTLGWLVGGPTRATRSSTSLVSGVRANGPALAIAAVSFHGQAGVRAAVITFAIFSIVGTLAFATALSRRATRPSRHAAVFRPHTR